MASTDTRPVGNREVTDRAPSVTVQAIGYVDHIQPTATSASERLSEMTDSQKAAAKRPSEQLPVEIIDTNTWDDDTLRAIDDFDAAIALVEAEFGKIDSADEVLGNGFTVLSTDQKAMLVDRPILLMQWRFNDGDQGRFVSIMAVAKQIDGRPLKCIVNDGSTGIMEQLATYTAKTGKSGGLVVKRGFRRSDYFYVDPTTDERRPATTFYLDASA